LSKKQKCPEFENHERWLVSFADMMTLLFALFVVLFALKEGGESTKIEQAAGSISETFSMVLDDIPIDRRIGPTEAGFGIFDHMRGDQVRPPISRKFPGAQQKLRVIDAELKRVQMEVDLRLYGDKSYRDPDKPGHARIVTIHRDVDGFRVRLLATHFFASGQYTLSANARKELDVIASTLKDLGRNITIEGHTDSIPSRGTLSNWDLSSLRATQVLRYFVNEHNFPVTRISAAGYADVRPVADNSTEAGRQLNRRIEIKIHYEDQ